MSVPGIPPRNERLSAMADQIPGVGALTLDEYDEQITPQLHVSLLGKAVSFIVFDYDEQHDDQIAACIQNFRTLPPEALDAATNAAFAYYRDFYQAVEDDEYTMEWMPKITEPAQVWNHIRLGDDPMVQPGYGEDRPWYVTLECECEWEEEHGLTIVFRNGSEITKVGPADGLLEWGEDDRDASGDGLFRVPDYS